MPRKQKSTRKIGNKSAEDVKAGIRLIRQGMSIRKAAKTSGVPFTTLKRYHWKTATSENLDGERFEPNYSVNKVFTSAQEEKLKEYFSFCALLFYGLIAKECRKIAYQCAKLNKIKMPKSWEENEMAGKDWLISFKRRNGFTSRRPEPCSLARATAFNRNNVNSFYNNLESLIKRNPAFSDGVRIFNLDETSATTVQKPQKIIAPVAKKGISKVTSGERGTLATTCCIISASGNALPPVMIFPRKKFKDHMIKNTPLGTLGLATPSGWMNVDSFAEVMRHFIKHSNSSKENPSILIMDNHESHLSIEAIDLARNSGVYILTLHPHTSGKLQPLDVGVFGPFKVFYNAGIDSWLMRHPGKPVTIYNLGEIIGSAFLKAFTPINITHSFAKCGIYPFDRNIFTDEDFLPSTITDRPDPCPDCRPREEGLTNVAHSSQVLDNQQAAANVSLINVVYLQGSEATTVDVSDPSTSQACATVKSGPDTTRKLAFETVTSIVSLETESPGPHVITLDDKDTSTTSQRYSEVLNKTHVASIEDVSMTPSTPQSAQKTFLSPFEFRNPIKAGPRTTTRKRRKPGRSMIVTDTSEKLRLEQEKETTKNKNTAKKKKTARKLLQSGEEDDDEEEEVVKYAESDDDIDWAEEDKDEDCNEKTVIITETHLTKPLPRSPLEGEYVIVQFATKKHRSLYVGKVIEERNEKNEFYISFLRRKSGTNKFHLPNKPDLSVIKHNDLKLLLPKPSMVGTSSRPFYNFGMDLSQLQIC